MRAAPYAFVLHEGTIITTIFTGRHNFFGAYDEWRRRGWQDERNRSATGGPHTRRGPRDGRSPPVPRTNRDGDPDGRGRRAFFRNSDSRQNRFGNTQKAARRRGGAFFHAENFFLPFFFIPTTPKTVYRYRAGTVLNTQTGRPYLLSYLSFLFSHENHLCSFGSIGEP